MKINGKGRGFSVVPSFFNFFSASHQGSIHFTITFLGLNLFIYLALQLDLDFRLLPVLLVLFGHCPSHLGYLGIALP